MNLNAETIITVHCWQGDQNSVTTQNIWRQFPIYINYREVVDLVTHIIPPIKLVHLTGIKSDENITIFAFQ